MITDKRIDTNPYHKRTLSFYWLVVFSCQRMNTLKSSGNSPSKCFLRKGLKYFYGFVFTKLFSRMKRNICSWYLFSIHFFLFRSFTSIISCRRSTGKFFDFSFDKTLQEFYEGKCSMSMVKSLDNLRKWGKKGWLLSKFQNLKVLKTRY